MLHDHRGADEVERSVGDLRNAVGGPDDGLDPREACRDAGQSRRGEVDCVHGAMWADEVAALESGEEGAVTATEVGERKWTGREMALEQAGELCRLEVERGLRVLVGHEREVTRARVCSRPSPLRSTRS